MPSVLVTAEELMSAGSWDAFCADRGYDAFESAGAVEPGDTFNVTVAQAVRYGILTVAILASKEMRLRHGDEVADQAPLDRHRDAPGHPEYCDVYCQDLCFAEGWNAALRTLSAAVTDGAHG